MNYHLISRYLAVVSQLIGFSMLFSLPWALPAWGGKWENEQNAVFGLLLAAFISFVIGFIFRYFGKRGRDDASLLRKESMAIVGLSWILATILGALPFLFSQTERDFNVPMSIGDAIFETQSGLSTTGATVIAELEDPSVVPRCILFWRSTTTFLGGVGFMALFVVLLGQGASGKAVLRMEQTKLSSASPKAKIRQTATSLLRIYVGLNIVLTVLLMIYGLSFFDALCHSFATIASGGFSTHNLSIGYYATQTSLNAPLIEWTIIFFMFLAGTNFILLFWCFHGQPKRMFRDIEWRTYLGIIFITSLLILGYGLMNNDFPRAEETPFWSSLFDAIRVSVFHVVSIMTTTGFVTARFELWNGVALMIFVFLMICGGCSGSTSGGTKVIRWSLTYKAFGQELERFWRPNVVRSLKLGDREIENETSSGVIAFLLLFTVSVLVTAFIVLLVEPNTAWLESSRTQATKMYDVLSASLAMFSNIGPGFGVIGAEENYGHFSDFTKILFSWAMLLGRLELFVILTMFVPSFWKN